MDKVEKMAEIFKALADPTRLKLVRIMAKTDKSLCVNALANKLKVTQSAVSQHLKVLKQAGIVENQKEGYYVHYSLVSGLTERYGALLSEVLEK